MTHAKLLWSIWQSVRQRNGGSDVKQCGQHLVDGIQAQPQWKLITDPEHRQVPAPVFRRTITNSLACFKVVSMS
jgi:hypothetical protein